MVFIWFFLIVCFCFIFGLCLLEFSFALYFWWMGSHPWFLILHGFLIKDNFNHSPVLQIQLKNWIPDGLASISSTHQTDICVKKVVIRVFKMQPFLISVFFPDKLYLFPTKMGFFFSAVNLTSFARFFGKNCQIFNIKIFEKINPLFLVWSTLINKCLS